MGSLAKDQQLHPCDSLLLELNVIWDEVGEPDTVRDKTLLELEQECLDAYRRKVDQANRCRAQLRQSIAEAEAELAGICSAIGEPPVHVRQSNQKLHGLREELNAIIPYLEEMRTKKVERWNQFVYVLEEIKKISSEIRPSDFVPFKTPVDQSDLSLRKLEELTKELESLQKEKADRVKQVMEHLNTLHSLCEVLDIDFKQTVHEVHPSLDEAEGSKNLSNTTIDRLASAVNRLREMKIQRMQKLQDFASTMLELWNLMDTPIEEQQVFQNVTCNIAASEHEITEPNTLSIDFLSYDDNRYNAGRGAHLTLKRAEKARILVNKIPGMVDILTTKIIAWENERGKEFTYDGVRLLSMLDEYMILRQEKEHEKKRQRDQKKLQDQLKAEQEALYGSKPSPSKPQSTKKAPRHSMGGVNRRMSMGGATMQAPKTDILHSKNVRAAKRTEDIAHLSPGSRGLDIGDLPIKKLSFNASALRETETPRKPFAQIMPPPSSVSSTPVRPDTNVTDNENRTPNPKTFGALNPKTPMTVAAPMLLAMTPAVANQVTAAPVSLVYEKPEPTLPEEIEYSFEERRLAFYLSREIA
ncbi:hypothetical protein ACQ4PT_025742 [Festuca glaucescens]